MVVVLVALAAYLSFRLGASYGKHRFVERALANLDERERKALEELSDEI